MARKIVIIGGGVAGLSAGCYGRMNGYDTEIFEMHTVPGGVCTGWKRKGYTFDGCLHFLVGTSPESPLHRMWQELGALTGRRVIDHEVFGDLVLSDGRKIPQYADVDRMVAGVKSALAGVLDAHDIGALDQLARDVKLWAGVKVPMGHATGTGGAGLIAKLRGMWKIRAYLPMFKRFAGTTEDFLRRFRSTDLRTVLGSINPIPGMPAMVLLMLLAVAHKKDSGWPEGGSLELARSIARRYAELGGVIHYGARVEEIMVRDGRAIGVRLTDGREHLADEVISAADGRSVLFQMLGGRYMSPELEAAYRTLPLYTPFVQVSFGVKRDLSGPALPRLTTVRLPTGSRIGGTEVAFLMLNNYAFDPSLAPAGKSAVTVLFHSPWKHWEDLSGDEAGYRAEKSRVLADTAAWLESYLPGIGVDIEVSDVATPLTTVRFTGNYHASYEGWLPTPGTLRTKIPRRLPGLEGFSMVGQWTAPAAGLPTAAMDGRTVIQEMCEQDGREFRTTVAPSRPAELPEVPVAS